MCSAGYVENEPQAASTPINALLQFGTQSVLKCRMFMSVKKIMGQSYTTQLTSTRNLKNIQRARFSPQPWQQ